MGGDQTIDIANATGGNAQIEFTHMPTGHSTSFKAMITEFSDQFTSDWNSEYAYGRMDPIQTFKRTGRVLSLGFDVPASNAEEAFENMRRISALIQFLYPTYDSPGGASSIKGSPIMRLRFFNWVQGMSGRKGLHGTLDGITFEPNMEFGVFHGVWGGAPKVAPKVMRVSCRLTVIHNHQLGWQADGKGQRGGKHGFRHFPYELTPHYNNLAQDEKNNQSSPRGMSHNPRVQKAREEFMAAHTTGDIQGYTITPNNHPMSSNRKPLHSDPAGVEKAEQVFNEAENRGSSRFIADSDSRTADLRVPVRKSAPFVPPTRVEPPAGAPTPPIGRSEDQHGVRRRALSNQRAQSGHTSGGVRGNKGPPKSQGINIHGSI